MMKKFAAFLCAFSVVFAFAGCNFEERRTADDSSSASSDSVVQNSGDRNSDVQSASSSSDETEIVAVNDRIELYSCSFRSAASSARVQSACAFSLSASSADYLKKEDNFYIDITLIDLEDSVDFIYTVVINGVKYRYSDGVFGATERNRTEKTVTFSVLLEYDGETDTYGIDDVVIMSDLSIRYYVTISEEYKPVVLPTRGGSGTQEDPYLVYNAEMFLEMSEYPAGTYFRQANDIDLSVVDTGEKYQNGIVTELDRWKPIGTFSNPFKSNYDGNGLKLARLSVQRLDGKYKDEAFGLFGYAEGCEIKNVVLEDYRVEVRYARSVGALVGYARDCTVTDCRLVQGRKENFESGSWSFGNMGGLVGFADGCCVEGCSVRSDLGLYGESDGNYPRVGMLGGVVGELRQSVLINCKFEGSMESGIVAGGVVGRCDEAFIAGCESDAAVTASLIAGGIVGQMWRSSLMMSSFDGRISFPTNKSMPLPALSWFGGIVGDAGLDYEEYSTVIPDAAQVPSVVESCRFSGEISSESVYGDRLTATCGGICARLFDCVLSDVEVSSAAIRGRSAFAFAATSFGSENSIASAVAGSVSLDGADAGITAGENVFEIYVESGLEDIASGFDVVSDWNLTDESGDFLLALSPEIWSLGGGRPSLLFAGLLPDELVGELRNPVGSEEFPDDFEEYSL